MYTVRGPRLFITNSSGLVVGVGKQSMSENTVLA